MDCFCFKIFCFVICLEEGIFVFGLDLWVLFLVFVIGCEFCVVLVFIIGVLGRSMVLGWGGINLVDFFFWLVKSVEGVLSFVCILVEGRLDIFNFDCGFRKFFLDGYRVEVGLGIFVLLNKFRDFFGLVLINLGWEGFNKKVFFVGFRFVICFWVFFIFFVSFYWYKIFFFGGGVEWGWRWVKLFVSCIGVGFEGVWNGVFLGGFFLGVF